jgi:hypothetical protein
MVAVAHQVEHRIVAPEVAGSRPVSHPIPFARKSPIRAFSRRSAGPLCAFRCLSDLTQSSLLGGVHAANFAGRKKKGAIHAPEVGVSGLGCLAVLGHP